MTSKESKGTSSQDGSDLPQEEEEEHYRPPSRDSDASTVTGSAFSPYQEDFSPQDQFAGRIVGASFAFSPSSHADSSPPPPPPAPCLASTSRDGPSTTTSYWRDAPPS